MSQTTFPLLTERLELRPFNDDDLEALFAMQSDERVIRYLPRGMRREAQLRENEHIKGEWTDEVICAVLAPEWDAAAVR